MTYTAAQARAELDRRAKANTQAPSYTAAQAQVELERRRSAGAENQPGILQQLFDVKNAETGKSYLYGNTPAPATYEDLQRTVADTVSRGYLDKLRGPEAQARTAAARERMPDWVELPTDIGVAVASSPYRIGSTAIGAVAGGLEGAASAYGHQKDWIPSGEDALDIAKGAGVGVVTGAGGAQLGKWVGKGWNTMFPEAPVQGPSLPPSAPKLGKIGTAVHAVAKQPLENTVPVDVGLHMLGLPPIATGTARTARIVAPAFQPKAQPGAAPLQPEPEAVAALRDYFSKMLAGYGRRP